MNLLFLKFDIVHQLKAGESGLESLSEERGLFVHEESILGPVYSCMFSTLLDFMFFFPESHFTFMTFCSISQKPPSCIKNPGILLQPHFPYLNFLAYPSRFPENLFEKPKKKTTLSIQDNFTTPRAVVSLRFFNCFRLLLEKAEDPDVPRWIHAR